jgi:hypothetical protein
MTFVNESTRLQLKQGRVIVCIVSVGYRSDKFDGECCQKLTINFDLGKHTN